MLSDVKNALAIATSILQNDVVPYFDFHKELSATDLSAITAQFLTIQTAILQCDQTLDSTVLAVEQKIADFNASSGSSASITGSYKNLKVSTTGLDSNVTVTCDELVLSGVSGYKTVKNVNLTFNTLDIGTVSASTWYAVFIITDGTTISGLLSLSATAPTLPTGYTFFARVGWIRTDATANKFPFPILQFGNNVQYKLVATSNLLTPRLMASGTLGNVSNPVWSAVSVSAFVPPTAKIINVNGASPNSGVTLFAPNNLSGAYNSATNPPPFNGNAAYSLINGSMVLESTNIYVACSVSSNYFCFGWEDNL
jgi:hypothetical protein